MQRWSFKADWWSRLATLLLVPVLVACEPPGIVAEGSDPLPAPTRTRTLQPDLAGSSSQPRASPALYPTARLGQPFQLVIGATMLLPEAGFALRFDQVLDDSRCAVNVECLWSGDATIVLQARRGTTSDQWERTIVPDPGKRATVGRTPIPYQGYLIEIQRLDPYPARAHDAIPLSDYAVTVLVTRRAADHERGHSGHGA